jgi:hypothetical protein
MADVSLDQHIEPHQYAECPICDEVILSHDKVETAEAHGRMYLVHCHCVERVCADQDEDDDAR